MFATTLDVPGMTNTKTVIAANGAAAFLMKGILRPSGLASESDLEAMNGSMKPSRRRPHAVMIPMTVRPANTMPCVMKTVIPWLTSVSEGM